MGSRTAIAEILREFIKASKENTRSTHIAEVLHLSKSTIDAWRSGRRVPSPRQVQELADYLFPDFKNRRNELILEVDKNRPTRIRSILKELDANERGLRVVSTSFFGRNSFLDDFFERFCRLAGVRRAPDQPMDGVDLKQRLIENQVDIGLGMFATLDRSLVIKFFPTPIRVGLNAVVLQQSLKRTKLPISTLQTYLARQDFKDADRALLPIVFQHDVGGLYVAKTLGLKNLKYEAVERFHFDEYGKSLMSKEEELTSEKNPSQLPVAVVDEITALYIMQYLAEHRTAACLVFTFSDETSATEEKRLLPEYLLSISIRRTNSELSEYLLDALRLFLRTEIQMVSNFYYDFCTELAQLARTQWIFNREWHYTGDNTRGRRIPRKRILEGSRKWVVYTMGLSRSQLNVHQDFELPWLPILNRVHRRLQKNGWTLA